MSLQRKSMFYCIHSLHLIKYEPDKRAALIAGNMFFDIKGFGTPILSDFCKDNFVYCVSYNSKMHNVRRTGPKDSILIGIFLFSLGMH